MFYRLSILYTGFKKLYIDNNNNKIKFQENQILPILEKFIRPI